MAEILGPGFIDTIFKELVTKKLTMQGDIELGTNKLKGIDTLLKFPTGGWGCQIRNIGDTGFDTLNVYRVYTRQPPSTTTVGPSLIDGRINPAGARIYSLKVFTASPVLANMDVGEIALGDGTGTGGLDEWFFKPDADKIVALASDRSARTITT